MFVDVTLKRNLKLIQAAVELHQQGAVEPDTYILDLDAILHNARCIINEADRYGIELYVMTKQFGRNPLVAKEIMKLGYRGAVAVDYREANLLYQHGIKLGHVGHLVQVPSRQVINMLKQSPEVITVYSIEKAHEISSAAKELGITQKILMRVIDKEDILYPAQYGGFYLDKLVKKASELLELPNIELHGLTSFPCFLFNDETQCIMPTQNIFTLLKAKALLKDKLGVNITALNTPSATCVSSLASIAELGGTQGEPGHALLGTTPLHAARDQEEVPAIVYVSEVSHLLDGDSYCYGGGHYRRSHMANALVAQDVNNLRKVKVVRPFDDSIDYYLQLEGKSGVGDSVVMAFRTQVFVTRSQVAVVKGISKGRAEIVGLFDSLGSPITKRKQ